MPPELFAEDPRVKKAKAYLVALGEKSNDGRAPNTGPDPLEEILGDILDVRPATASKMVLEWDLSTGCLPPKPMG